MEAKKQIRKELLAKRNALSKNDVTALSEQISIHLQQFLDTQSNLQIHGVYGYYPRSNEVSLMLLYTWLLEKKIPLAFPRVLGNTMEFYQVNSMEDFKEGAFHIFEPKETCIRADLEKAFCLVPGSVFDWNGNRYGYGKGYYDKYFSIHRELKRIGIAYDLQIKEAIPTEKTDIQMQLLATENGLVFI